MAILDTDDLVRFRLLKFQCKVLADMNVDTKGDLTDQHRLDIREINKELDTIVQPLSKPKKNGII